jgi:hypothetical protein
MDEIEPEPPRQSRRQRRQDDPVEGLPREDVVDRLQRPPVSDLPGGLEPELSEPLERGVESLSGDRPGLGFGPQVIDGWTRGDEHMERRRALGQLS